MAILVILLRVKMQINLTHKIIRQYTDQPSGLSINQQVLCLRPRLSGNAIIQVLSPSEVVTAL